MDVLGGRRGTQDVLEEKGVLWVCLGEGGGLWASLGEGGGLWARLGKGMAFTRAQGKQARASHWRDRLW